MLDLQKSKSIAKISADDLIGLNPRAEIRTYNNSISFPNKIQVNESFTINYEWTSTGLGLTESFALYPDKYMPKGSNVTIILPPWVEFIDNVNYEKSDECSNFVHGKFDLNTINTSTQFGNFSVKYTQQPSNSYVVADITFGDGGSIVVVESQNPQLRNNTNGTIHLYQSSYDEDPDRRYDYDQNVKCVRIEKPVTSNTHAQSTSDATLSPKKQMDAGIEPYNVVCKEELLLVERNQNKIACVSEKIAQKFDWTVINNTINKTTIPHNEITTKQNPTIKNSLKMNSTFIPATTSHSPPSSSFIFPTAYENGTFSNFAYVNSTFPNYVRVSEPFTIHYSWSTTSNNVPTALYLPDSDLYGNTNVAIVIHNMKFIDPNQADHANNCYSLSYAHIEYGSENISDRSGNITVKFTHPVNNTQYQLHAIILFADDSFLQINASDGGNGKINLVKSIKEPLESDIPCFESAYESYKNEQLSDIDTSTHSISEASVMPECIDDFAWNKLYEDEKTAIIDNPTTCQMINGSYVTNLPPGWNRMSKVDFDFLAEVVDISPVSGAKEFIEVNNISGNWTDDFISYYNKLSKQSSDFFIR